MRLRLHNLAGLGHRSGRNLVLPVLIAVAAIALVRCARDEARVATHQHAPIPQPSRTEAADAAEESRDDESAPVSTQLPPATRTAAVPDHHPSADPDADGTPNARDACPFDAAKTSPGICGCGIPEGRRGSPHALDCPQGPGCGDAGLCLVLVPDRPDPYAAGERITVAVRLDNRTGSIMDIRRMQLDTSRTSPEIDFAPFGLIPPDGSVLQDFDVYRDPRYHVQRITLNVVDWPVERRASFPQGSSIIANVSMTLPTEPGTYVLDVVNRDALDINTGALFDWDFACTHSAWSGDGSVQGGRYVLIVDD